MKSVAALVCFLAAAEAGILSPAYVTHPVNAVFYPVHLGKVVGSKPLFTAELFKPNLFGAFPHRDGVQYVTVVESPLAGGAPPVLFIPAPSSTVVAGANAVSPAGAAESGVVATSDEPVPYSVVASAGPAAAYSSAVVHPGKTAAAAAAAHASVTGGAH